MATDAQLIAAISAEDYALAERYALELSAETAGKVDKSVGDLRLSLSQQSKQYATLAKQMQAKGQQAAGLTAVPFAGGITVAAKAATGANAALVQPAFTRDLHSLDSDVLDTSNDD